MSMCLAATGSVSTVYEGEILPGLDTAGSVESLMVRQSMPGVASDYYAGYETELKHMLGRRLELLSEVEAERVIASQPVVSLRMLLEAKKDGRRKARLVLQGFKEPLEWDTDSNASPVAFSEYC